MSVINAVPLLAAAGGDYTISRSVRLRSSASAYFNRTFGTPTNQKIGTFSFWVKRGSLGARRTLVSNDTGTNYGFWEFDASDRLNFGDFFAGNWTSTSVYRDPSAWYHIVIALDSTAAVNADRIKVYVNNRQDTTGSATITQNSNWYLLQNASAQIGAFTRISTYFDGYLTEINFIDGQALTPSSFGETDTLTGVWKPKKYAGTYGTNGFYLNFSDNSNNTAATIGKDYSGNGNNWTPNNISVTAGSNYDSMLDVPTPYADGGNGRGNYCVLNAANKPTNSTLSEANLKATGVTTAYAFSQASFALSSGKWYFEVQKNSATTLVDGVALVLPTVSKDISTPVTSGVYSISDANTSQVVTNTNGGSAVIVSTTNWANADIIQCAYDADSGKIWFGRNGSWYPATNGGTVGDPAAGTNQTVTGVSGLVPTLMNYNTGSVLIANFGQRPFTYTPPSGFKALNTQNLPAPTIKKGNQYFDATAYSGNSATQNIVNSGAMQPDLVWIKNRTNALSHYLNDSVRGAYKTLFSNLTNAEYDGTSFSDGVSTFNSNGFTLLNGTNAANYNQSANNYVGWQWKAGGSSSSNTNGSITSTVSVNATAGFSVVTYSGNGAAGATVGHGLGVAPNMIIVKCRTAGTNSWTAWQVYHSSLTNPATSFLRLNETSAVYTGYAAAWNSTNPTSSVFSVSYSGGAGVNGSGDTFVAYCFAEVAGFSKLGSYQGNGSSDGPFVFCNFRPRWVMIKCSSTGGAGFEWYLVDTARNTFNLVNSVLYPNLSDAEATAGSAVLDITSNGFKIRGVSNLVNASGGTYIFAAFAENPFKYALAR